MTNGDTNKGEGVPSGSVEPTEVLHEIREKWNKEHPDERAPAWPPPLTGIGHVRHGHHHAGRDHAEMDDPPTLEGDSLVSESSETIVRPSPLRFTFGDMSGIVFWIWIPALLAFFLPWDRWVGTTQIAGTLTASRLVVAAIIAIPPWIVLTRHLTRGRMWDGVLDMFLWAIWASGAMIILCYLYPIRAEQVIWNASTYWEDMRNWIQTGGGTEGTPALWLPMQGKHLIMLICGAFIFGLPALVMGVLQLNYMNYYVSQVMYHSTQPLIALPIAWHFWSVIRVAGYIIIACSIYQLEIAMMRVKKLGWSTIFVVGGMIVGLLLVVMDALLKMGNAELTRQALIKLTHL